MKTAITAGSDLLIVNSVETSTSDPAKDIVDDAKAADIPVISFNREVADNDVINSYEKCAFVGANAILTESGKPELDYCDSKATTKYLVDVAGKWSAQAANDYMVTLLGNYNKDNNMVELIICNNDGMAEGAIAAL